MFRKVFAVGCAIAAFALAPTSGQAQSDASLEGKTIRIVVAFGEGGTYGIYAQMLARHIPEFLPGKPTIIVQFMPGGGGIAAANYAYNVMPKDGTGWLMPSESTVVSEVALPGTVKYRADKFAWLGTVTQTNTTIVVRGDSPVKSVEDLKKFPIPMGTTGNGAPTYLMPHLMNSLFGTKMKLIPGYKGAKPVFLAFEQKEVDGSAIAWSAWVAAEPDWFKTGFARPIVQLGLRPDPEIPDVPLLLQMAKTDEERTIVRFLSSMGAIGRSFALPPGMSTERVAMIRGAFAKMVASPAFLAEAKKRKLAVNSLTAAEIQSFVEGVMQMPPATRDRARKLLQG